jgi:aspartate ammonia-lyase
MPRAEARDVRVEHDLLGEREIPAHAYWGVHTLRAVENFPITGRWIGLWPELVRALALVKHAAAQTNYELGLLDETKAKLIIAACLTNMNANEVIANRALELAGRKKGDYAFLHPIEHVNMAQSTNDVYPTALRLALRFAIVDLIAAMEELKVAFAAKSVEFRDLLKVGRTQLQDAVPMTLGQEFSTFAVMLGEDQQRLAEAGALIEEINLGATAIGTGINSHPGYAPLACKHLVALSGVQVKTAENLIEATQDCGA